MKQHIIPHRIRLQNYVNKELFSLKLHSTAQTVQTLWTVSTKETTKQSYEIHQVYYI